MRILGIHWGHDSSLCLLNDGRIEAHLELERVSRVKKHSIKLRQDLEKYLMLFFDRLGLGWDDVDSIALINTHDNTRYPDYVLSHLPPDKTVAYYDHHDCHAASAFYLSPYDKALILTVDGGGNDGGACMYRGHGSQIDTLDKRGDGSIGQVWSTTRAFFSETVNGPIGTEGVLMGASPYGELDDDLAAWFTHHLLHGEKVYSIFPKQLKKRFGRRWWRPRRRVNPNNEADYFRVCRSLQHATEGVLGGLFDEIKAFGGPGSDRLVLSGGVMLNCVAIGKLAARWEGEVFVAPSIDDAGLSIGACLLHWHRTRGKMRTPPSEYHLPYLGFDYSDAEVRAAIANTSGVTADPATVDDVARLVADGRIVALYHGRSESGKRALGNRSIVADPRHESMKDQINRKVKMRHWYRPFAPAVLADRADKIFEMVMDSPYMSVAVPVRDAWRDKLQAVRHIDGTARVQTVQPTFNRFFYDLIHAFGERTGVPVLLNTSFNESEPIVDSPADAIACFLRTDIDYLYLEGTLIAKKEAGAGVEAA